MRTDIWMRSAEAQLREAGIATAHLDVLVLLEDATKKERSWLLAHPEFDLPPPTLTQLNTHISRRTSHEPLAYIRQRSEFYGRDFYIDHHVLEPRPESETMIELLDRLELPAHLTVADIGTGSGALGITAALEHPTWQVILTDIDPLALQTARHNLNRFSISLPIRQGDLLSALPPESAVDLLLCNLPYVPTNFQINPAAMAEPRTAIFGGTDGLDLYRTLFLDQLPSRSSRPSYILTESLPPQHELLDHIAQESGYSLLAEDDFIQAFTISSQPSKNCPKKR